MLFLKKTYIYFFVLSLWGCQAGENKELPIIGEKSFKERDVGSRTVVDTIHHQIPDFQFINQDNQQVTQETFRNKIYVADFFFTTCPSICPAMKAQMLRVYERYEDNEEVMLLSHTVDPEYDSVAVLKKYAQQLGITDSKKWHFVTGDKEKIYQLAQKSYLVTALENEDSPGGVDHSGAFVLVDKERRIRGIYDGTDQEKVDDLIEDITVLLKSYKKKS